MVTGSSRHALSLKLGTPDKKTMNAFLTGLIKVFSSWLSLCVLHGHPWAMTVIREVDILIGQTWVTCPHHPTWLHGTDSPQVRRLLLSEDGRDAMPGIQKPQISTLPSILLSCARKNQYLPVCTPISFISSCCIASHGVLLFCPCPSPRCTAQGAGLTLFGIPVPSPCLVHSRYSIANVYWNVLGIVRSIWVCLLFTEILQGRYYYPPNKYLLNEIIRINHGLRKLQTEPH